MALTSNDAVRAGPPLALRCTALKQATALSVKCGGRKLIYMNYFPEISGDYQTASKVPRAAATRTNVYQLLTLR